MSKMDITIEAFLIVVMISFIWGTVFKTYVDGCFYRRGVRHGYRVAQDDISSELDEARRVLRVPLEQEADDDGF